jgi:hypothetical protein
MFIDDAEPLFVYDTDADASFYFCCEKCLILYIQTYCKEGMENMTLTLEDIIEDMSVELDDDDVYTTYRKTVHGITYLSKVQAPKREM